MPLGQEADAIVLEAIASDPITVNALSGFEATIDVNLRNSR